MAMATAMGDGNSGGNGNGVGNGNGDGDGNRNGDGPGKGNNDKRVAASSCAGNVQRCGRGDTLHKGKCIHQRCIMGRMLQRVFAHFQGGGFLTAHHVLFFIFYNYCSVY
jgi:hypothetical protein